MKICRSCFIEKPFSEFWKRSGNKDGLQSYCKLCVTSKKRQYVLENPEKVRETTADWRARNQDKVVLTRARHYEKHKEKCDSYNKAWAAKNKERSREIALAHYRRHRNKYLVYKQVYDKSTSADRAFKQRNRRKNNPDLVRAQNATRRSRKLSAPGTYTKDDVLQIGKLQKWKCAACRDPIENRYHVDHIQPLSNGGSNDRLNIQLLCPTCNTKKSAKDPIEFMQSKGFLI